MKKDDLEPFDSHKGYTLTRDNLEGDEPRFTIVIYSSWKILLQTS